MSKADIRGSRYRAWETRRAKYGPKGYSTGAYKSQGSLGSVRRLLGNALDEISQARRQCQILLYQSEYKSKAARVAIDRIDNAWRIIEQL
jgi:hypothetical protein